MAAMSTRWGFGAGTAVSTVEQARSEATWAQSAGFDSFWISQAFGVDPIVALSAIATDVPGLAELGTSVVPLPGRHPLGLGAAVMTAQSACNGRFTLGLGPSHQIVAEAMFGESWAKPFGLTVEFTEALLSLFGTGQVQHDGEQITAHGSLNIDAEPTPILIAALGPKMLQYAGERVDGTSVGQCGPHTIASHIAPHINAAAESAGRPAPRIVALVNICVTDDRDAVLAQAAEDGGLYGSLPSYRRMLDIEGVESPSDLLLVGSADEVTEGLARYVDAGATDLRVGLIGHNPDDQAATRAFLENLLAS